MKGIITVLALGAEMDIAIRMQREDIFNAMHKI